MLLPPPCPPASTARGEGLHGGLLGGFPLSPRPSTTFPIGTALATDWTHAKHVMLESLVGSRSGLNLFALKLQVVSFLKTFLSQTTKQPPFFVCLSSRVPRQPNSGQSLSIGWPATWKFLLSLSVLAEHISESPPNRSKTLNRSNTKHVPLLLYCPQRLLSQPIFQTKSHRSGLEFRYAICIQGSRKILSATSNVTTCSTGWLLLVQSNSQEALNFRINCCRQAFVVPQLKRKNDAEDALAVANCRGN